MKLTTYKNLVLIILALFISGVAFAQSNPGHPWSQIDCAGCVTSSNILDSTISSSDIANSAVIDSKISSMQWTKLYNYPGACSSGQFISAINDTITCSTPTASGVSGSVRTKVGTISSRRGCLLNPVGIFRMLFGKK